MKLSSHHAPEWFASCKRRHWRPSINAGSLQWIQ